MLAVADLMVTAAKTAPKGSGKDTVVAAVVTGEEKERLSQAMRELGEEYKEDFILSLIHIYAVAGVAEYPTPQIIIDMGTATTFSVISSEGSYLGGVISTGMAVSAEALFCLLYTSIWSNEVPYLNSVTSVTHFLLSPSA